MSCDLRVLKRFTPAAQEKKHIFPKKNQGFCRISRSGIFRFTAPRGANQAANEFGRANRPRLPERRLDLIGRCHNMPA